MPKIEDFSQTLVKNDRNFQFLIVTWEISSKKIENVTFYKNFLYQFNHPFIELVLYRDTQISIL
jgi:hypothetical protein